MNASMRLDKGKQMEWIDLKGEHTVKFTSLVS